LIALRGTSLPSVGPLSIMLMISLPCSTRPKTTCLPLR
jgi:hypothetical protein